MRESTAIADDTAIGTMTLTKNRRSIAVLLLSVLAGAAFLATLPARIPMRDVIAASAAASTDGFG